MQRLPEFVIYGFSSEYDVCVFTICSNRVIISQFPYNTQTLELTILELVIHNFIEISWPIRNMNRQVQRVTFRPRYRSFILHLLIISFSDSLFFFFHAVPTIIIAHEFFDALPVHQFQVYALALMHLTLLHAVHLSIFLMHALQSFHCLLYSKHCGESFLFIAFPIIFGSLNLEFVSK